MSDAVLYDMPPEDYHRHPALSSSGARRLLPPSCPALFRHWQTHEQRAPELDLGKAAHTYVLTEGEAVVEVEAPDWRTNAAKAAREQAYTDGKVPLLTKQLEQVKDMAAAIRANKLAAAILDPSKGRPEVSGFWTEPDDDNGVDIPCRFRADFLRVPTVGRVTAVDYKSTTAVDQRSIESAVSRYGYHVQQAWYERGIYATGLAAADLAFLFIFQAKTPPYLTRVVSLPAEWVLAGDDARKTALDTYRRCLMADEWPGYGDEITELSMPRWAGRELEDA